MAAKNSLEKIYAFEIQQEMAEMATRSIKLNDLDEKINIINEDIVGMANRGWSKKFDVVVSNPPYKKENTGLTNISTQKLISRHEVKCKLEDLIFEVSKILKDHGVFYMVHRPERLVDICSTMRANKLEPKEIRFVYPHQNDKANLVLIKGVKCGKAHLNVLKPLIVYNDNNEYTDEIYKIYDKEK